MTHFKFLKAALITSLFSLNAFAQLADEARLSPSESLNVLVNGQPVPITLKAAADDRPLLRTNLKRSLRLVDTDEELTEFLKRGVELSTVQSALEKNGVKISSWNDLVIVKNFMNGVKGFKAEDIYKKSMAETDESNFWYAIMPKSVIVKRLLVQREWFSSGIGAHGQLRFILNSPVLLVPLSADITNRGEVQDMTKADWKQRFAVDAGLVHLIPGDFVYSLYSLRYFGGPMDWSFVTGMTGVFANAYTLSSTPHNVVYLANEDFVEQNEMAKPQELGTKTLFAALNRGDSFKETKLYHLVFNSCITELNRVVSAVYPTRNLGVTDSDYNPYTFIEHLKPLITKSILSLNEEFQSPIKNKNLNPQVQKNMKIIQTKEFETALILISMEALKVTYKEFVEVKTVVAKVKNDFMNVVAVQKKLTTEEILSQVLEQNKIQITHQQQKLVHLILTNQKVIELVQYLAQKGM